MIQSEYLSDLRHKAREIRNDSQKSFYFLETQDLLRRPAPGKWNILEVFAHINIYQSYYIRELHKALDKAPENEKDETSLSWLGKQFIQAMEPREGVIRMKMKTFKKTDPLYLSKKKGIAVSEKVVFRDFINDIEELEEIIIKAYDKELTEIKVPTFLPFLKVNIADALGFCLAHTERHVLQAKNILEGSGE